MSWPDLAGKVAIVTGGASGIGAATARLLENCGAKVTVFDLMPGDSMPAVNVTDPDRVEGAVQAVLRRHGTVDLLVNNAGGGPKGTITTLSPADWHHSIMLNLSSAFFLIRAVTPVMQAQGRGSIVNVASIAAKGHSPVGGVGYASAKAGLVGLTRHTAVELAPFNIRVNAVCPGPTRTPLVGNSSRLGTDIPLGRWAQASDVAATIAFLLSDAAAMCTGIALDIDGGLSLRFA